MSETQSLSYDNYVRELPVPDFRSPPKWTYCSCVEFAKWLTGHNDGITKYGVAGSIVPNTIKPTIGDWILLKEGSFGHVATIVSISSSGYMTDESNWKPCQRSSRLIAKDNKNIRGFFRP